MSWRDIVRKGHCGMEKGGCKGCPSCEKQQFEKKYVDDSPFEDKRYGGRGMPKKHRRGQEQKDELAKKLIGNQKKIDANKDGKITGEDFAMLNETKKARMECPKCKGKGCEHCDNKGYHTKSKSRGAFTDES